MTQRKDDQKKEIIFCDLQSIPKIHPLFPNNIANTTYDVKGILLPGN